MYIILLSHFFPPNHTAGTENYTFSLAKSFQKRGHEVTVVCAGNWETGNNYWNGVTHDNYQSIPVWRAQLNWIKARDPNRALYYSQEAEEWFGEFLDSHKPDLVHVTSNYSLGVGVLHSIKERSIPLILTLMDFWFSCPRLSLVRGDGILCEGRKTPRECQNCLFRSSGINNHVNKILTPKLKPYLWELLINSSVLARRRGARGYAINMVERKKMMLEALVLPDVILSHSQTLLNIFLNEGLSQRITYLKNGHDLSWLPNYEGKSKSKYIRIGYIGQIIYIKGVHLLIEAFKLADLENRTELVIWGDLTQDHEYVEKLYSLIENDKSILLKGRFSREEIARVFSEIDILVVPSLWYENAPLVIYEAFATKTPVLATDLGGMAEAVDHEVTGLLFKRGDVTDLANHVKNLVFNPTLLEKLVMNIKPVKTIEQEVDELIDIYTGLLDYS